MSTLESFPFESIANRGSIREADVQQLRRTVYEDGRISPQEAEQLIALNAACPVQDQAWHDVFQEALTDFMVHQAQPSGYVTLENSRWLVSQLAPGGQLASRRDLDLIVHIIDVARWSPQYLVSFAIGQVRDAVCSAQGGLRSPEATPGMIDDADVELVRSIIYAFGGDGNVSITRSEAELLCDINDKLDPSSINAAWTELYVKALANFLLANSGYKVPSREQALRSEAFLETSGEASGLSLVRSITRISLEDINGLYSRQSREECTLERLDREYREMVTGEQLTVDEAEWITARFARDGGLSAPEIALIEYLKENALALDEKVSEVLDRQLNAA
ncbi:MAG: hypothetical protein K0U74_14995 [Alphaproteobacteria bacterium]|nr:hypothetical protein [Alphaproteobacteria bacterium]